MNTELLLFLLGLLLSIPISILGNVLTRKYDDALARRSVVVNEKKLKTLVEKYRGTKKVKDDLRYILFFLAFWFGSLFYFVGLLICCAAFAAVVLTLTLVSPEPIPLFGKILSAALAFFSTGLILYFVLNRAQRIQDFVLRVFRFDEYEQKVFVQVEKLGGNLEELLGDKNPEEPSVS